MSKSVIQFDSSTDGGASLRHAERLSECCARLGTGGIAVDELHKWSDVLDLSNPNRRAKPPIAAGSSPSPPTLGLGSPRRLLAERG